MGIFPKQGEVKIHQGGLPFSKKTSAVPRKGGRRARMGGGLHGGRRRENKAISGKKSGHKKGVNQIGADRTALRKKSWDKCRMAEITQKKRRPQDSWGIRRSSVPMEKAAPITKKGKVEEAF